MAQDTAESLRAKGINPRTMQPYKRTGGAYKAGTSEKPSGAAILKVAEAAQKAADKKESDKELISKLKSQISSLEAQLKAEISSTAVAVEKAKLDATAKMHSDLLARYKDGLRDGASLSRGRSGSLASDSPASSFL